MQIELLDVIKLGNTLGEGVLYDRRDDCLWWTDIAESRMYRLNWPSKTLEVYITPERLCAFGLTPERGRFIAAFATGFAWYWPEQSQHHWISRPLFDVPGMRLNDGRVDHAGRFWCGTVAEDNMPETIAKGRLYCLRPDMSLHISLQGFHIANSICWSGDGKTQYFADSPTGEIHSYDTNPHTGTITHRGLFAKTAPHSFPDGSVTDHEDHLWTAEWGGSRIVRRGPDGNIDSTLNLPVSQPTCPAFGGPNNNILFVTTARENLTAAQLAQEPDAGNLFIYRTTTCGQPVHHFSASFSRT